MIKMFVYKKQSILSYHGFGEAPFGKLFGRGFHGFGPGGFGANRFERGDLKLFILDLLNDKPRHGYDIILELEKKFHGFYSPSPGSVYPILQLLEDQEFVLSDQKTGKKVYTITSEGKRFLNENADEIKNMQSRTGPPWGEKHGAHIHELRNEIRQTAQLIFCNAALGALKNPETMKRLKSAFEHFRIEVETIFSDSKKEQKATEGK